MIWRDVLPLLSILAISGCVGTAAKRQDSFKADTTKIVKIPVISMDVSQANSTLCPKKVSDLSKRKIGDLIRIGNSCVKTNEFNKVEEIGNLISSIEPFQPWGSYFLSLAAEARGEIARAKWMIELSIKKNPSYAILHYQKGRLEWLDNEYAQSMSTVKKAVEMEPGLYDGHLFLGQIYFRDQEFEKASEHFYMVLKAKPSNQIALSGLAESRIQRGDYRGALELLNRAIGHYPDAVELYWRQAQVFETGLNDLPNALNSYQQARRRLKNSSSQMFTMAEIDSKIQQLEQMKRQPAVSSAKKEGKQ